MNRKNTPELPFWFLKIIANDNHHLSAIGDLVELFFELTQNKGKFTAWLWIWKQVLFSLPYFLYQSFTWSFIMFKNYLKIAVRNIQKNRSFPFINVAGLTIGITCSALLLFWVQDELSFDRFHENADEIYRIILDPLGASPTHEANRLEQR